MLENVTKRYPGQARPAVDGLTLEIPAGSIVMFVGPSGCGKTTTLKMINRLIEPSNGKIVIGDEDVTNMNGDRLRRKIGYVIQAGGLFPHMTVASNIATVPKMLGWDKERIAGRVDELLELVSLDPDTYRNRYPKELSGGQQQRIGVARALAADPPVLLMDEPFGAVDPITRQRLQDELLHIQAELHMTVVCVTHDFDEAMKLGDWIAIFNEGGKVEQYDSPERILSHPANDFVEGFIGSGAGLKQLSLSRVNEIELRKPVTTYPGELTADVVRKLESAHAAGAEDRFAVVLDSRRRPINWLSPRALARSEYVSDTVDRSLPTVGDQATLNDALDEMLVATTRNALVVGNRGAYLGSVDIDSITQTISAAREIDESYFAPIGLNTDSVEQVTDAVRQREERVAHAREAAEAAGKPGGQVRDAARAAADGPDDRPDVDGVSGQ